MLKRLGYVKDHMYEVKLVRSENEHKEPIIVGFFILQYAKLKMLELYFNFSDKFYDVLNFEELEMVTDSLYVALSEQDLYDCIRPSVKEEWSSLRRGDCKDVFSAVSTTSFFPRTGCTEHNKHNRQGPGLFKELVCTEMVRLCNKPYCCYGSQSNKSKIKAGIKEQLKIVVLVTCPNTAKYWKKLLK